MQPPRTIRHALNRALRAATGFEIHRPRLDSSAWLHRWLQALQIQTVVDVGAHIGSFSKSLYHVLPSAQFHLFEPLPDCYELLVEHSLGRKNVYVYRSACGDHNGESTFFRSSFAPSSSLLEMADRHKQLFPASADSERIDVPICKLDDAPWKNALGKNIFLKMDVQGYEDRVLRGAVSFLRRVRLVQAEVIFEDFYSNQATFAELVAFLADSGFVYSGISDQVQASDGKPLWADVLFFKPCAQSRGGRS